MTTSSRSNRVWSWLYPERLFDWKGRASRAEYAFVSVILTTAAAALFLGIPQLETPYTPSYWTLVEIAGGGVVLVAGAAVIVRRLHDLNLSGYLGFLYSLPARVIINPERFGGWRATPVIVAWTILAAGLILLGLIKSRTPSLSSSHDGTGGIGNPQPDLAPPPRSLGRAFYEWQAERNIRKHGWVAVEDDGGPDHPPFTYSAGLQETAGFPEIVICGLPGRQARNVLAEAVRKVRAGETRLADGVRIAGLLVNFDCVWRKVDATQLTPDRFGTAIWRRYSKTGRYDDLEAFQLVWPDLEGRFPWEPGCDRDFVSSQMELYRPLTEAPADRPVGEAKGGGEP